MVTCGHSYCEPCIERYTRNTRNCVICKQDVGPLEAMIPSITLDNMVRKLKNQENIETSYDDLFICEERTKQESPKCVRTMSQRSKRRLFFSIAGPHGERRNLLKYLNIILLLSDHSTPPKTALAKCPTAEKLAEAPTRRSQLLIDVEEREV